MTAGVQRRQPWQRGATRGTLALITCSCYTYMYHWTRLLGWELVEGACYIEGKKDTLALLPHIMYIYYSTCCPQLSNASACPCTLAIAHNSTCIG